MRVGRGRWLSGIRFGGVLYLCVRIWERKPLVFDWRNSLEHERPALQHMTGENIEREKLEASQIGFHPLRRSDCLNNASVSSVLALATAGFLAYA